MFDDFVHDFCASERADEKKKKEKESPAVVMLGLLYGMEYVPYVSFFTIILIANHKRRHIYNHMNDI